MNKKSESFLKIENISKFFKTSGEVIDIFDGLDFEIHEGEMVFVLGRSGSGKSTFLNMLGGLDKPNDGKIIFKGKNIVKMSDWRLSKIRNRDIGFVFQFYHLLPELTVFENVLLPTIIRGRKNKRYAEEMIGRVQLSHRRNHYPSQLSGGEQQRAAIARALVNKPALVLCDEPTGNLDTETAEVIANLIRELNEEDGQTFVIVTHDQNFASRYKLVYQLEKGKITPYSGPKHSA